MDSTSRELLDKISGIASSIGRDITIMEVCGGHTNTIMRYGIRDILPKNIRLISGPGCPVCVSSQRDIDSMIKLAREGVPVATYGDMLRVPGSGASLEDARSEGAVVEMVYSATEALKLKQKYDDLVFFGIGFETTAPMAAYLLKRGVMVYSVHKLIPPAMKALAGSDLRIDGFIDPGHVSTIIGTKPYEAIRLPQVISGFEPGQIIRSVYLLLKLIQENKKSVVNGYPEAVRPEGNTAAQRLMKKYFHISASEWRGLGKIGGSGLEVADDSLNAKIKYRKLLEDIEPIEPSGCRCGDILKGIIEPKDCPLFAKACTPDEPKGACMVSQEGSCQIAYAFSNKK